MGTVPVESYCARAGSKRHRHAPQIRTISPGAVPKIWAYGRSGLMNRASNVSKLAALMKAAVGQAWHGGLAGGAAARRVVSIPRCVEGRRNRRFPLHCGPLRGLRAGICVRDSGVPTRSKHAARGRRHGIETHAGVRRGDPIWRHAGEAIGGGLGDVEIAGIVEDEAGGRGERGRDRVDGATGRDLAEAVVSGVGDVSRRWPAWECGSTAAIVYGECSRRPAPVHASDIIP